MNAQSKTYEFYVFQDSGQHLGPTTADVLAKNVLAGNLSSDALIGAAGGTIWEPIGKVPSIRDAVQRITSSTPAPSGGPGPSDAPTEVGRLPQVPRISGSFPSTIASPPTGVSPLAQRPSSPPYAPVAPTPPRGPSPVAEAPLETAPAQATAPSPAPTAVASIAPANTAAAPATPAAVAAAASPTAATVRAAAPAAPAAAATATAPTAAPKPAAAAASAKAEAPKLDPKFQFLPIVIFGACGAVAAVVTVVTLLVR